MPLKILKTIARQSDLMMAVGIVGLIGMMLVPLPPLVLDVLITINLALALCILLVCMYTTEPMDFSVFPSLLLVTTLYRLALSISATRLILLHGNGGRVIEAFGKFVVGGDLVVGLIIFLILVAIQFIVITNGAGRVAEVAARFTLDEMPGKQMAVDADLNAGLINESQARQRRRHIEKEADFYGSMDGATKFVRGDAIAGLIIVGINLIGGLIIGVLRLHLPIGEAVSRYCLLTVGDGLVSQLPALLISTATGLLVTRNASEGNLGSEVSDQLLTHPRAVLIAAGILLIMGMVPGLPKVSFFLIGGIAGLVGYYFLRQPAPAAEAVATTSAPTLGAASSGGAESMEDLTRVDRLRIELGYELLSLTEPARGGDLPQRIKGVRRQAAERWGLLLPAVRLCDNLQLAPTQYVIRLRGVEAGRGEVHAHRQMAIKPRPDAPALEGLPGRDPVFGLDAYWIESSLRPIAEARGYTVVEASTVIATHLAELITQRTGDLLSRQDVHEMIEKLRQSEPAVVKDLVPDLASVGEVQQVLRALLAERVPVRDLAAILEALADALRVTQKLDEAVELVRISLGATICQPYCDEQHTLQVVTLDPSLEEELRQWSGESGGRTVAALPPRRAEELLRRVEEGIQHLVARGREPVLLVSPPLRRAVKALVGQRLPAVAVLSHAEIPPGVQVQSAETVDLTVPEMVA
ncbi:MAG TPA: flagellar biosynthesis protein FlhA [Armatimonadota bacterium]|jgi:flagellar biosynthesis protein FlhA